MARVQFVAGELHFEWDAAMALSNRRKHGVSFEEAAQSSSTRTPGSTPIQKVEGPSHGSYWWGFPPALELWDLLWTWTELAETGRGACRDVVRV